MMRLAMALPVAALQAIPSLAGTDDAGFAWTIYTGDLVSHDAENQLSRQVPMTLFALNEEITRYSSTGHM